MRLGIRPQLVLSLSILLTLAFVLLFSAVSHLTRATIRAESERSALVLGRSVAHVLSRARDDLGLEKVSSLAQAALRDGELLSVGLYDAEGRAILRSGFEDGGRLPGSIQPGLERVTATPTASGSMFLVVVPEATSSVAVLVRGERDADRAAPLLRLVGLYTALFALSLLVFTYIALTRLIVHPIDALSATARRVAAGARKLEFATRGPVELADLSASLAEMTATLTADERSMREQIAELERQAQALRSAQERLVRSERLASVGRLSAGLAHELGNPIASLLGLEDLLLSGGLTRAEETDFLARIRGETERIHRILRKLLDFARPAAQPEEGGKRPGSVSECITNVLALVRPQPAFRGLTVETRCAEDLPPVTLSDEGLTQVLLNLLLNAADAAGPSGHVRVSAEREGDLVRLRVEDDGPGVDPKIRPRLFEPFATTKDVGKGTGLGLAVCRGLVESARGSIFFEDHRTRGAACVILLPVLGAEGAKLEE